MNIALQSKPSKSAVVAPMVATNAKTTALFEEEFAHTFEELTWPFLVFAPTSSFRVAWDLLMMICMLYIFLFTPLEITYGGPTDGVWSFVGSFVDLLFWMDVFICFRTAFIDAAGLVVTDPKKIALFYVKDFFVIDFFCCLPGFPLSLVVEKVVQGSGTASSALKLGKAPRVIRVVRSVKIVKVLRALKVGRYLDEVRDSCPGSLIAMKMVKLLCLTSFFLHINACAFSLVAKYSDHGDSWTDSFMFDDWQSEYTNALYWAATTSTTVGYGDISPVSDGEKMFGIVSMVMGVGIYGYIIGSMTDVVSSTSHINARYQERMDEIFEFVRRYNLPRITRRSMIQFYRFHYQEKTYVDERNILDGLTPKLLESVCTTVLQRGLVRLRFFRTLDIKFFSRALHILVPREGTTGIDLISSASGPSPEFFILTEGRCHIYHPTYESPFTPGAKTHEERKEGVDQLVKNLFDRFGGGDGLLSLIELKTLMQTITNSEQSDKQLAQLITVLDKDGNGTISQHEFTAWFLTHKVENLEHRVQGKSLAVCEINRAYGTWSAFNLGRGKRPSYVFVPRDNVTYFAVNAEELLSEFKYEHSVLRLISDTLVEPARKSGAEVDLNSFDECEEIIARTISSAENRDRDLEVRLMRKLVTADRKLPMDVTEETETKRRSPRPIETDNKTPMHSPSPVVSGLGQNQTAQQAASRGQDAISKVLTDFSLKIDTSFKAVAENRSQIDRQIFDTISEKQSQTNAQIRQELSTLKEELKQEFRDELKREFQNLKSLFENLK